MEVPLPPRGISVAMLAGAALLLGMSRHPRLCPSWDPDSARKDAPGARCLGVGLLVGSAVTLAALAAAVGLAPGSRESLSGWLSPEILATCCALALLLRPPPAQGEGTASLLGAAVAGLVTLSAAPVLSALGAEAVIAPLPLALIGAAACSFALAPARHAKLVARAHAAAVRAAGDGILCVSCDGRLLHVSESARSALEFDPARTAEPESAIPAAIQRVLDGELPETVRWKSPNGRAFEAWAAAVDGAGASKGVRGVLIRDVTTRQANERKLVRLAHYDSLTGLANRRLFLESLTRELADAQERGGHVALYYIDLDHFKSINDTLGHASGDALLQGLADRLRKHLRSENLASFDLPLGSRVRIARLAGDEFAVIVPGLSEGRGAAALAQRILELIAIPMSVDDHTVHGSGSVGLALFPEDASDVDTLIRHADSALYAAKSRGRKRFARFDPSFEAKADRARLVSVELEHAIDRGELALHYQPKVDLLSGSVVGFEALLRWKNQDLGFVGPGEFIPVAESLGMICRLGSWVVGEACRQLRAWKDAGFECVPVSINVSSQQFAESDLQRVVSDALKEHRVDPELLELELTESLFIDCSEATELCLRDMHAIGIRIALDDFGTGYSALTYLNRFDLDVLKMDRALLLDIHTNASAVGIASAVVSMAHSLGLTVVAEGIDTEAQLEPLRQMKCDQVQGFLFAQALPAEQAAGFLARAGEAPPIAQRNTSPPGLRVAKMPGRSADEPEAEFPVLKQVEPGAELPAPKAAPAPAPTGPQRVLIIDDGSETLGRIALRLGRLGVDLHYASEPDEGLLLIAQETDSIRLLVLAPGIEMKSLDKLVRSLESHMGARPPFVVIGEEPDAATRTQIREAGANWVLWEPFNDAELRYLVKSAMAAPSAIAQRLLPRVPVDLVGTLRAGHRREVAVISSLSARGAFIQMSDPLPEGSTLQLEFEIDGERFRGFGRVVHQALEDPADPSVVSGVGVAFFGIDRGTTRLLLQAVQERVSRFLP